MFDYVRFTNITQMAALSTLGGRRLYESRNVAQRERAETQMADSWFMRIKFKFYIEKLFQVPSWCPAVDVGLSMNHCKGYSWSVGEDP